VLGTVKYWKQVLNMLPYMQNVGFWAPFRNKIIISMVHQITHKDDHFVEFISVTVRDRGYLLTNYQKLSAQTTKNASKLDEK
jgi:hypothetical protein